MELGENMSLEEMREMIDDADKDGDNELSLAEFKRIFRKSDLI